MLRPLLKVALLIQIWRRLYAEMNDSGRVVFRILVMSWTHRLLWLTHSFFFPGTTLSIPVTSRPTMWLPWLKKKSSLLFLFYTPSFSKMGFCCCCCFSYPCKTSSMLLCNISSRKMQDSFLTDSPSTLRKVCYATNGFSSCGKILYQQGGVDILPRASGNKKQRGSQSCCP